MATALGIKPSPDLPFLLYRDQYTDLYKLFHPQSTCASCGATSKRGTSFSHHSPDTHAVSLHLEETTGIKTNVNPGDLLCTTCYKLHLSILKALETQQSRPSDNALKNAMSIWDLKLQDPTTDTLTKATLKVVLYLSESLLQQRAVLLPTVCQVFLETYAWSLSFW